MSSTGLVDYKKPSHRRDDSGELDVFEAARYFSGYNDNYNANMTTQKAVSKEERRGYMREGRVSLDVPSLNHYYLHQNKHPFAETQQQLQQQQQHHHHHLQQQQQQQQQQQKSKEKKKYFKQPSSPGGKIAQFLNSLFSQTNSKKKKSLSSISQTMKEDDESPVGRRKRRSSISHFRSTSSAVDARSLYSTSSSGFRTPPPYNLNTPSKSCKDFRSFSDYKDVLATLSKYSIQGNSNNNNNNATSKDEKNTTIKGSNNFDWVDDKLRLKNGLVDNKSKNNYNSNNHGYQEKKEVMKKFIQEHDDGADSDSSSDLFELQIDYDFGFCSSGLPVYETTHMDSIKRSSTTAITNGPIKA